MIANVATINNKGLEVDLRMHFIKHHNFQWTGALNVSGNRSKVLGISGDFSDPNDPGAYLLGNTIVRKGQPLGLFYGLQFKGIIKDQKTLDDYKSHYIYYQYFDPYLGIGDPMFALDSNGFGKQDIIGRAEPKFYGGFTNTFTYKSFSLITLFTFSYGGDILYLADVQNQYVSTYTNKGVRILDRWTPQNPNSTHPRLLLGYNSGNLQSSNNVYDGSYLKLKSITLTYQLPAKTAASLHIKDASVYGSATNVFTITKYPGPDPEVSNNPYSLIDGSTDVSTFPTIKQYNLGIRVGF